MSDESWATRCCATRWHDGIAFGTSHAAVVPKDYGTSSVVWSCAVGLVCDFSEKLHIGGDVKGGN